MLLAASIHGWRCPFLRHLRRTRVQPFRCSSSNIFTDSFLHVPAADTVVRLSASFIAFRPCLPLLFTKFAAYKLIIVLQMDSSTEFSIHLAVCIAIVNAFVRRDERNNNRLMTGISYDDGA
jgi:hypothetical protein